MGEYAWFDGNAWDVGKEYAHPVAQKKANPFDLYDMHGNVEEWCSDWYDSNYYRNSPSVDPKGPNMGTSRVLRGGTFVFDLPGYCRSAIRYGISPDSRRSFFGFRVVLVLN